MKAEKPQICAAEIFLHSVLPTYHPLESKMRSPTHVKPPSASSAVMQGAAVVLSIFAVAGCGGGEEAALGATANGTSSAGLLTAAELQPQKLLTQPGDWPEEKNHARPEAELAQMETVERTLMGGATELPANLGRSPDALESALTKGFDNAAQYSVGFLSADVGPAGDALEQRSQTMVKRLSLTKNETQAAVDSPDVLYIRAGSIDPKLALQAAVFKQAVAQQKSIVIEREEMGREKYEDLLWTLFSFVPVSTNAVLVRSLPGTDSGWQMFMVEKDSKDDEQAVETTQSVNVDSSGEYKIDLDTIASIVKGSEIKQKMANKPVVGIEPELEKKAAVKQHISGKYLRAQQWSPSPRKPWVINPETWQWEVTGDACQNGGCGAYGSTAVSHNVWGADLANVVWWDDWIFCGNPTKVDKNVYCGTGYTKSAKKISGYTQQVGAELGVSLSAEGEVSVPFISKAKVSTTVSTKASYGKTWYNTKETTFEVSYNNRIAGGYMARFGRGDWSADVSKWLTGRHERFSNIGESNLYNGPWKASTCWNVNTLTTTGGTNKDTIYQTMWCASAWNQNFSQRARVQKMKTFGAKVWAVCKVADSKCRNLYKTGNTESLEKLFPL